MHMMQHQVSLEISFHDFLFRCVINKTLCNPDQTATASKFGSIRPWQLCFANKNIMKGLVKDLIPHFAINSNNTIK